MVVPAIGTTSSPDKLELLLNTPEADYEHLVVTEDPTWWEKNQATDWRQATQSNLRSYCLLASSLTEKIRALLREGQSGFMDFWDT
jgi:hypothetical protein